MESEQPPVRQIRKVGPVAAPETEEINVDYSGLAEQKLTEFVVSQIDKMKRYSTIGSGEEPTFIEINDALMNYEQTHLSLLAMHNSVKWDFLRIKNKFDAWYADKYIEVREELNPRSVSAQKWYSQKEIEMYIRKKHPKEYEAMVWELNLAEQQINFCRRLLEGWQSQQFILTQLSKNLIAEMSATGVADTFAAKTFA